MPFLIALILLAALQGSYSFVAYAQGSCSLVMYDPYGTALAFGEEGSEPIYQVYLAADPQMISISTEGNYPLEVLELAIVDPDPDPALGQWELRVLSGEMLTAGYTDPDFGNFCTLVIEFSNAPVEDLALYVEVTGDPESGTTYLTQEDFQFYAIPGAGLLSELPERSGTPNEVPDFMIESYEGIFGWSEVTISSPDDYPVRVEVRDYYNAGWNEIGIGYSIDLPVLFAEAIRVSRSDADPISVEVWHPLTDSDTSWVMAVALADGSGLSNITYYPSLDPGTTHYVYFPPDALYHDYYFSSAEAGSWMYGTQSTVADQEWEDFFPGCCKSLEDLPVGAKFRAWRPGPTGPEAIEIEIAEAKRIFLPLVQR